MQILPLPQQKNQKQTSFLKRQIILSNRKKVKTEPVQQIERDPYSDHKISFRTHQNAERFTEMQSIFCKRKRSEYSGYKQFNFSKNKNIRFKSQETKESEHKPQRKYELNLKNIARLRKKFSIQSSLEESTSKIDKMKDSINQKKVDLDENISQISIDDERRHEALRRLLKNVESKVKDQNSSPKTNLPDIYSKKNVENLEQQITRPSLAFTQESNQTEKSIQDSSRRMKRQKYLPKKNNSMKINSDKYFCSARKETQTEKIRQSAKDQISGWETKSFFDSRSHPYSLNSPFLKLYPCEKIQ